MRLPSWWLWKALPTYRDPHTGEVMRFLDRESARWYQEQLLAFESGAEVRPPWVEFPGAEPWSFKQGRNEVWFRDFFRRYWRRLSLQERQAYLARWEPPADYWTYYLLEFWK